MKLVDISGCTIEIIGPDTLEPNTTYIGEIPKTYRIALKTKDHKSVLRLGEYPTKEKAIQVLDDMQYDIGAYGVFEMPQYDEV